LPDNLNFQPVAAILQYYDDPFRLLDLIDKMGSQTTLQDAYDAVYADIDSKLGFICPRCQDTGHVASGPNADIDRCGVCYGKGKTEEEVLITSNPTYAPAATQPTVAP